MRKAVWGAAALAVSALSFGTPVREIPFLHRIIGLFGLVGYLLLSFDPPERSVRFRNLMLAGIICSVVAVLLVSSTSLPPVVVLARLLGIASVALPLWLSAGPMRSGFIAAGVLALVTIVDALEQVGGVATSLHAYVLFVTALLVGARMHNPALFTPGEKKPPRVVVASNIVTLTPEQKAKALARLERQFAAGEMPEHVYLDKRQELESR